MKNVPQKQQFLSGNEGDEGERAEKGAGEGERVRKRKRETDREGERGREKNRKKWRNRYIQLGVWGTSLVVQWLRICLQCVGHGSDPWWES